MHLLIKQKYLYSLIKVIQCQDIKHLTVSMQAFPPNVTFLDKPKILPHALKLLGTRWHEYACKNYTDLKKKFF